MKKIRILAMLLMLCLLASPALAELRGGDTYVEPMSGASITLPDGWKQYGLQADAYESYFSMSPEDGGVYLIAFGATDLYSKTPEMAKSGVDRFFINNGLLDADSVADLLDIDPSEVQYVAYDHCAFFIGENSFIDDNGEQCISICAICYYNGYMYLVRYMGYDRAHEAELTKVLNSFML